VGKKFVSKNYAGVTNLLCWNSAKKYSWGFHTGCEWYSNG